MHLCNVMQDRGHTVHLEERLKIRSYKPDLVVCEQRLITVIYMQVSNDQYPLAKSHGAKVEN